MYAVFVYTVYVTHEKSRYINMYMMSNIEDVSEKNAGAGHGGFSRWLGF